MKNKFEIKDRMKAGGITSASFATVDSQGHVIPDPVNIADPNLQLEVTKDTVFQCASLSKPVFAYLVLKLIETNKTKSSEEDWVGKFKTDFNLKTPLYTLFKDKGVVLEGDNNPFLKLFSDQKQAKQITAEMVLSHTTGLPIVGKPPYQFQFEPGTHYAYSGPGIECLQVAIKELTGLSLETLAREHVFGEHALKMPNSTYGSEGIAANSLKTTAEEYAKFIVAWINDDKLNYAFNPIKPADSMTNDFFPNQKSVGRLVENINIEESDRNRVAWGLGIGLVKNEQGQVIGVYHTGDSGEGGVEWRAGFGAVIDPQSKRCIEASVYLTKSPNGHILAEKVLPDILKSGLDYFFPTYGFARNAEELDGTNFHGMNPQILKAELKEMAYKTKPSTPQFEQNLQSVENPSKSSEENVTKSTDSTQKMFHQMNVSPLSTRPVPSEKTVKSQEKETSSAKQVQEVEKTEGDTIQEERQFNPTPLSTSYDPYKQ
ncbi:beta-lactamase family protein [Legionella sp. PATHC038]|uniref:serine hydrolase domain-containing protein n=1 Tax=Legionella sheltonii TaxID=2992041 RepID=UPI0022430487|nr:serine hydrolase domain-containing protein [Legionella sp. PATHC038]MCW8399286.1 beta-lactamase family protein [Legionella sp. PATHC038]MCW8400537.1 beta-lactamase family protein [Legionella sp. PATHC038]